MHKKYEDYAKTFESFFNSELQPGNVEDIDCSLDNTSIADYVWLPFRFDGEMAYLDWKDEWRIEDHE